MGAIVIPLLVGLSLSALGLAKLYGVAFGLIAGPEATLFEQLCGT